MNDSNFSNYDSFFCGSAFQDLQATHISETEQSSALHYFNSLSNDLQTQQGSSVHHLQFPITSAQQVQQPVQPATNINVLNCNVNSSNNINSCSTNASKNTNNNSNCRNQSLPFVQIHTTDVQPPHSSYGNIFRRNPANHEEIKSEPIKSESAETTSKEASNATPTPTPPVQVGTGSTSNDQLVSSSSNVALTEHKEGNNVTVLSNLRTEAISTIPKIFKCSQCIYISLSETGVQQHVISSHSSNALFPAENKQRMMCPGCENTFYSHKSLYVHLCEDHRMCLDEANKLLQAVIQKVSCLKDSQSSEKPTNLFNKEIQPKIYLKNVECLREPRHDTLDEQSIDLNDNNYFQLNSFDDGCSTLLDDGVGVLTDRNISPQDITLDVNTNANQNQSKQKISIKSVDVLREPGLLRRDFEMQSLNLLSQCNEHELHNSLDNQNQFTYPNTEENNPSSVCENNPNAVHKDTNVFEKPRRPKIYIKNVDILKEPLVLPSNLNASDLTATGGIDFTFMSQTLQQNSGNFNSDNVTSTPQVFDPNGNQLSIGNLVEPFLYDGTNSNFLQNINDMDTFSMANTQNNNTTNYLLESPKYQTDLQPLNTDLSTGTPLVTEPTPPPLPVIDQIEMDTETQVQTQQTSAQQKQKIFIKNVDILKQPQFQEHRRTLHLRTVDELNLMNKTEVENLIAPNLDAPQNLLNQKYCESNTLNNSSENSKNSEETSFSDLNLKISESDPVQSLNNWTNDYSLGEDLDCIITEHSEALNSSTDTMVLQKQLYDLDTPQMSVISIRDLEEITEEQESASNCLNEQQIVDQQDEAVIFPNTEEVQSISLETQINHNSAPIVDPAILSEEIQEPNLETDSTDTDEGIVETIPSELKCEQSNTTSESTTPVAEKPELIYVSSVPSPPLDEVSPAPPVAATNPPITNTTFKECALPVPPLVPVSPTHTTSSPKVPTVNTVPEKGRIYVSDNLMEITTEKPVAVSVTGGTSNRGRPFGSNRTGITKIRKLYGNAAAIDVGMKCSVHGCAFRFKKPETLDYHKRCHTGNASSPQSMICPECQSTNFSNWNTLHTHLWRSHKVDMELYSCELCQFKTPIYSRLVNTHSKIHSDERNYKCDQCEKAFKNSKQLKNHRRWHRNASSSTTGGKIEVYRCNDCGSGFSHQKSLREHICKESSDAKKVLKCEICDRAMSSKSSLKLHMLTHEAASRFQCEVCDYRANDHNAFRRHRMIHDKSKMYICPYCDYKSIQSVAYQKHIQQKHPESADNIVLKCNECNFSTINRTLLTIHMVKHRNVSNEAEPSREKSSKESRSTNSKTIAESATNNETETVIRQQQKNKIKVKSDLLLTDPTKFSKNAKSTSVTSLLVHCFDDAIT